MVGLLLTGALVAMGLTVVGTAAPATAATASWTQLSPTTSPPPTRLASMVYHPGVGLVLFGGESSTGNMVGDTWVYAGSTWTDQIPNSASTPAPRVNTTMAYDAARGETVLFGGYAGSAVTAETWTFDGSSWTHETPTDSPPARDSAMMAYDASTQQVVLYGGYTPSGHLSDTWTWNGSTWTEVTGTAPPARYNGAMAYDAHSGQIVLFGGSGVTTYLDDTWTFDGSAWTEQTPSTRPTARAYAAMAYYPSATSLVLSGGIDESGSTIFSDTWTYDGIDWSQQSVTGPARWCATAALEESTGRVVLFGGDDDQATRVDETWAYGVSSVSTPATWTHMSPAASPPALLSASMAGHPGTGIVLFGGMNSSGAVTGDTWVYDGTTWNRQIPSSVSTPPARYNAVMVYDAARGQTMLFGGSSADGNILSDTWTYDGSSWTKHTLSTRPAGRYMAAMAYDATTQRVVLFGGISYAGYLADTWTWDGSSWTQVAATGPSARVGATMAYDPSAGTDGAVVLFGGEGGSYSSQTWTFDGSAWALQSPATSPPGRMAAAMAYDADQSAIVLFGGLSTGNVDLADTWTYHSGTWTERSVTGPPARQDAAMAYDQDTGQIVLFGGWDQSGTRMSDTWVYGPTSASAPGAPPAPVAVRGNATVDLSWTAPDDGGSAITSYTVAYTTHGGTSWTPLTPDPATATSMSVTGLTNGTSYDFKVLASNDVGDGPYSPTTTATPATVPGAPAIQQTLAGDGQVSLTWTAPSDGGSAITSYTVSYTPSGGTEQTQTVDPPTLSTTVTGLTNGTSHDFKVLASNDVGDGPYSSVTTATPLVTASAPAAPAAPDVVSGNGEVLVSWNAPADGGSAITGYTLAWRPVDAPKKVKWSTRNTLNTSETVSGLTNHVQYAFKVLATNAIGDSPFSSEALATPFAANAPDTPTGVTGVPQVVGRSMDVALTWADGGNTSSNHEVVVYSYRMSNRGVPTYREIARILTGTGDSSCLVQGLSASKVYAFTVAAGNTDGWSLPSTYSDPVGG